MVGPLTIPIGPMALLSKTLCNEAEQDIADARVRGVAGWLGTEQSFVRHIEQIAWEEIVVTAIHIRPPPDLHTCNPLQNG